MKTNSQIKNITRLSLREQVYESIKMAIITLELEPGQKIKDQYLAEKFNVSRTPVREALRRLEDEKLVESKPGSITRIAFLNTEEVKQAFTVIATLHSLAARLAVSKLTKNNIKVLHQINGDLENGINKGDVMLAIKADDRFHEVFLTLSENQEISIALERLIPKVRRLEFAKFGSLKGVESVRQHNQIISAGKQKDYDTISELVEQNWLSLGKQLTN